MQVCWGIIGCGNISSDFVNALSLLSEDEHKVVAVAASNSLERAETFKTSLGLSHATPYGNYNELYSDRTIGKHVMCEKPMGMNPKEVSEMVECARKKNKFLMEGFWSRFWPAYDQLRTELFVKRSIGDVKMVTASFGYEQEPDRLKQFTKPEIGGSAIMALGCYTVMFASLAFDHEKPENILISAHKNPKTNMDLTGSIILKYSGDRLAQLAYSFTTNLICDATIVGSNKKYLKLHDNFWCPIKLECPDKTYNYDLPRNSRDLQFNFFRAQGFVYEASCVRDCIMKGLTECPKITLDQSLVISEIIEECRKQMGVVFQQDSL